MDKKILIPVIIAIAFCLYPLRFGLPVGQTDQAHFYGISTALKQNWSANSPLPLYANYIIPEVETAKDYPLLYTTLFALESYIIPDFGLLNGLYLLPFLIIGLIYTYKITRELGGSDKIGIIAAIFLALNLRVYYFAIAGVWPFLIASLLAIPSIYYFITSKHSTKNTILAIIFSVLTLHAHPMMGVFLLGIETIMLITQTLEKSQLVLPVKAKLKFSLSNTGWMIIALIATTTLFAINAKLFVLTAGRTSWISEWITYLLSPLDGFQTAWKHLILFDGPIISGLGLFGIIWAIGLAYKNNWKALSLWLSSTLIVISPWLLFGTTKIATYTQKFLLFYYIVLAITFLIAIQEWKYAKYLIAIALIIQFVKLTAFMTLIQPAITPAQYQTALELQEYSDKQILYVYPQNPANNFAEFKWIPIIAKSNKFWVVGNKTEMGQEITVIL